MIVILRKKITMQWSSFVDGQNQFVGSITIDWEREKYRCNALSSRHRNAFANFHLSACLRIKYKMEGEREGTRSKNRWEEEFHKYLLAMMMIFMMIQNNFYYCIWKISLHISHYILEALQFSIPLSCLIINNNKFLFC